MDAGGCCAVIELRELKKKCQEEQEEAIMLRRKLEGCMKALGREEAELMSMRAENKVLKSHHGVLQKVLKALCLYSPLRCTF